MTHARALSALLVALIGKSTRKANVFHRDPNGARQRSMYSINAAIDAMTLVILALVKTTAIVLLARRQIYCKITSKEISFFLS